LYGNVDNLYDRLKHIRNNPRRVEVVVQVAGDVITYPSIYKAGKRSESILNQFTTMMVQ